MEVQNDIDYYALKKKETINIMPLGDLHIGSNHTNYDYIKYAIRSLKKRSGEKRVYLLGDLLEVADKRVGDSVFNSDKTVNEQLEEIIKILKPIKKNIVSVVPGNHEKRLLDTFNFNITKEIANILNIKLAGYQTLDKFKINDKTFSVHSYHGKGRSQYLYTAYSKVLRETQNIEADLYLYGHLHALGYYQRTMIGGNGVRRKHYVLSGHFLKYDDSYADAQILEYRPESFCILTVNGECRVSYIPFFSDERSWKY